MKKVIFVLVMLLGFCHYVYAQPTVYVISGSTIENGITRTTIANTAVPLSTTSIPINEVQIECLYKNNQPVIYVGSSTVTVNNGKEVTSGSVLTLKVDNLNKVYITSNSANDGVSWIAVTR